MSEGKDQFDWQPATSAPGEIFTPEGRIRSAGVFARGMVDHDPRLRGYRRSMWRTGLTFVAVGLVVAIVLIVIL